MTAYKNSIARSAHPYYVLSPAFVELTKRTARKLQQLQELEGKESTQLLSQVARYTKQVCQLCNEFYVRGNLINATEFDRDAKRALVYALRQVKVTNYKAAAEAIDSVGCCLIHIPESYGVNILAALLSLQKCEFLRWPHYVQLSRLAQRGPTTLPKPKRIPWLDIDEGENVSRVKNYRDSLKGNRRIWDLIAADIHRLAQQTISEQLTPIELETVVHKRLGTRPRGRPARPKIDYASKVVVPPIMF